MPDLITPADLEQIKATCDAASAGPWIYEANENSDFPPMVRQDSKATWHVCRMLMDSDLDDQITEQASVNGPFIALARTWLPRLLEEMKNRGCLLRQCAGATMNIDTPDYKEVPRVMDSPLEEIPGMVNSRICDLEIEVAQLQAELRELKGESDA